MKFLILLLILLVSCAITEKNRCPVYTYHKYQELYSMDTILKKDIVKMIVFRCEGCYKRDTFYLKQN